MNIKHFFSYIFLQLFLFGGTIEGQIMPIDVIHYSGTPSQVTNMVIMGDGYTLKEQDKFIEDAKNAANEMLMQFPWITYRENINIYAIKVISEETGASLDPKNLINNYFGSSYWSYDIERLLVAWRSNKASSVLMDNAPFFDIAVIVVNDSKYGGSGGTFAVFSTHESAPEIMIHELGHSFAFLADEYWAGSQYARETPNMTGEKDPIKVKWKDFLNKNEIGIFPHEEAPNWQRPHQNCKMRFLGRVFCNVCSHELVNKLEYLSIIPEPSIPIAFFGADKLEVLTNEKINFFDFSSYSPTSWEWSFDEGIPATSTEKNPEVSYPKAGKYKVTLKAKNEQGENVFSRDQFITVMLREVDDVPPSIKIKNIEIALDYNGNASVTAEDVNDGTTDNVELQLLELSQTTFDCSDIGENIVVFKAIDTSGNESIQEAIITVVDNINPTAKAKAIEVFLDENGIATLEAEAANDGSFDNCSIAKMTLSKSEFRREDAGENKVIFSVFDSSSNADSVEITVNVNIILFAENGKISENLKFYPNPANDIVFIEYSKIIDPQLESIEIMDVNGRILDTYRTFERQGNVIPIEVKALKTGKYFIRLNSHRSVKTLKLSIVR